MITAVIRRIALACALACPLPVLAQPAPAPAPLSWKTGAEAEAIERRIDALIGQMTLEEKVGQLNLTGRGDGFQPEWIRTGRSGSVMNFIHPADVRRMQDFAAQSRLRIPLLLGLDAINGYATYFPQPLGQAATFNADLMELAAYWTAREARAAGINWTFAPMVDMSRDPRWGRVMEGAGEDVLLATVSAAARTRGYHRGGMATSAKHFIGYGEAEGGRDYNTAWVPLAKLFDYHLPAFRAALDAGVFTVMTSLSSMNGVPATADRWLLRDLLKRQMQFRGFVVSDYASIEELIAHGVAADSAEAARKAILAGVDMDMFAGFYDKHLADEVRAERVPIAVVDEAVRRVLRVKFHMGLFDEAPVDAGRTAAGLISPEAQEASRAVARESMILLKNDDDILPIRPETRSIAVIGAFASIDEDWQYADNVGLPRFALPTLRAELLRLLGTQVQIRSEAAVSRTCGLAYADRQAALSAAREAEMIVAVLGEDCDFLGESASRTRLDLPGVQNELLEDLIATGKPIVLVLKTARPLVLTAIAPRVKAIIQTFHLGSGGRTALAEILTGRVNPSGKVPMSFPRAVGQIPVYYDQLPTGRPPRRIDRYQSLYMDEQNDPLYPFGFGLSYTRFGLGPLRLDHAEIPVTGTVTGSVDLANVGGRAGSEVVQIYVRQRAASRSRPIRQLRFFEKVTLEAGATRPVRFSIPASALGFHDDQGRYHVEPGDYEIMAGTDSRAALLAVVRLTGEARVTTP